MTNGLVSVIIPAYQADRFITETLESVGRQSYAEWEVIVVEDGSHGATEEIVRAFARSRPTRRIDYQRHEENRGVAVSRNTAISLARGEYIAFLDADDLWLPSHLEAALGALEREDANVAYATSIMFDDATGALIGLWGPTIERLRAIPRCELRPFPNWLLHRNFFIPSATVLRRCVIDEVGVFDADPRLVFSEDLDYWLRCVRAGLKFVHVHGCHCLYRKGHADAATSKMAMILGRQAFVLGKHVGMTGIPLALQRRQAAYFYTAAGVFNLDVAPRLAAHFFWHAWLLERWRIERLALAAWAYMVLPWLPNLGIVRRWKKSKGY